MNSKIMAGLSQMKEMGIHDSADLPASVAPKPKTVKLYPEWFVQKSYISRPSASGSTEVLIEYIHKEDSSRVVTKRFDSRDYVRIDNFINGGPTGKRFDIERREHMKKQPKVWAEEW